MNISHNRAMIEAYFFLHDKSTAEICRSRLLNSGKWVELPGRHHTDGADNLRTIFRYANANEITSSSAGRMQARSIDVAAWISTTPGDPLAILTIRSRLSTASISLMVATYTFLNQLGIQLTSDLRPTAFPWANDCLIGPDVPMLGGAPNATPLLSVEAAKPGLHALNSAHKDWTFFCRTERATSINAFKPGYFVPATTGAPTTIAALVESPPAWLDDRLSEAAIRLQKRSTETNDEVRRTLEVDTKTGEARVLPIVVAIEDENEAELVILLQASERVLEKCETRVRRQCQSCRGVHILNPEFQARVGSKKRARNIISAVLGSPAAMGALLAGGPTWACRRCQGMRYCDEVAVLCPACGSLVAGAPGMGCGSCGDDLGAAAAKLVGWPWPNSPERARRQA